MTNYWVGKKVKFRAIHKDDMPIFKAWDLDSEGLRRVDSIHAPKVDNPEDNWIEKAIKEYGKKDSYTWVIENHDDVPVGMIATFRADLRIGNFFYAITVGNEHRRKGYASEMIQMMLRFMFEERRYRKCTAMVYDFNEPSMALHRKNGFIEEGRIRNMGYTDGKNFDVFYFGILAEEWAEMKRLS